MTNRDPIEINGRIWTYDESSRTHKPRDTKAASDHATGQAANMERNTGDESLGASKGSAFNSRVSVRIVSYRSRLADPDNISGKAALDGCVHCGILRDDSTKEIASYRADEQIKVKNASEEKTEIVIEEIQ